MKIGRLFCVGVLSFTFLLSALASNPQHTRPATGSSQVSSMK